MPLVPYGKTGDVSVLMVAANGVYLESVTPTSCPYCRPGSFDGPFNDEHVIPARLGGTLVVRAHKRCNEGAAVYVDNPLMRDPDVEMLRGLSGAKNTRTGGFKGAQFGGKLADRAPALLRSSPEGVIVEQVAAGEPQLTADGEFVFSVPPDDIEARTDKVLEGLRQKHPDKTVELTAQEPVHAHVSIERSWNLMPWVWPRFAAKVALGVLSRVMPPEWRGSDGELFLLALFRRGEVYGSPTGGVSALPTQLECNDGPPSLLYPWEHTIVVQPEKRAVFVTIDLFGELRYRLGIATHLEPIGPRVWLCDYREKEPLVFDSMRNYVAALAERYAHFGDLGSLRHDRPRGQLLGPTSRVCLRETPLSTS